MLQAALGGLILLGVYRFMKSNSEYEVDWWMAFTFIFVPAILIFLLALGLAFFELPPSITLVGYALYFIVPFLILKAGLEFPTKSAMKFSVAVPIVAILTEIPFVLLLQGDA